MTFAFDIPRAVELVSSALLAELGDDVDLIFRYGSLLKGHTHAYSDLDISYVPRGERGGMAITVLVNDILLDLYPIPWAALERMARFEDPNGTILHEGVIVYARDTAVAGRFQELGAARRARMQPEARPEMLARAQEIFREAAYPLYLLRREAARGGELAAVQQAQAILRALLHCLAVANQASIDTRKLDQVLALPAQPPGLAASIARIMTTAVPADLLAAVEALMDGVHTLLLAEQAALAAPRPLAETLAAAYPELKGDIQHLILACERRDPFTFNLVSLLHELHIHIAWAVAGVPYSGFNSLADYAQDLAALGFPDLLGPWAAGDYEALAAAARRFDARLRAFLLENDVPLNDFATLDDLARYLAQDM